MGGSTPVPQYPSIRYWALMGSILLPFPGERLQAGGGGGSPDCPLQVNKNPQKPHPEVRDILFQKNPAPMKITVHLADRNVRFLTQAIFEGKMSDGLAKRQRASTGNTRMERKIEAGGGQTGTESHPHRHTSAHPHRQKRGKLDEPCTLHQNSATISCMLQISMH